MYSFCQPRITPFPSLSPTHCRVSSSSCLVQRIAQGVVDYENAQEGAAAAEGDTRSREAQAGAARPAHPAASDAATGAPAASLPPIVPLNMCHAFFSAAQFSCEVDNVVTYRAAYPRGGGVKSRGALEAPESLERFLHFLGRGAAGRIKNRISGIRAEMVPPRL